MLKQILKDQMSILFFRNVKPATTGKEWQYLTFGLFTALLAGIGRYWDNPRAELWQYLGLGSVIYCILLATVILVIIAPMKPRNWHYSNVLIFVSFTSLPALLYAIPVEKFLPLSTAQTMNVWFLAVVALWRVLLFGKFLSGAAGLNKIEIVVATLLPIVIIINVLSFLNLEHVVFRIMAGIKEHEKSANDTAYLILVIITIFSYVVLPFLLIGYGWAIYKARKKNVSRN